MMVVSKEELLMAILGTVTLAAVLWLGYQRTRLEKQNQDDIKRLRLVLVTTQELPEGTEVEGTVVRRLAQVSETTARSADDDWVLTSEDEVRGMISAHLIPRGRPIFRSDVKVPAPPAPSPLSTADLPVTVDARTAAGLAPGNRVAFAKRGELHPEPADGVPYGYEIAGRVDHDAVVTLTVRVPVSELKTAAILATSGWFPLRVENKSPSP